jgi:hypothetical protein
MLASRLSPNYLSQTGGHRGTTTKETILFRRPDIMKTQHIISERQTRLAVIFTVVLLAVAFLLAIAVRSDAARAERQTTKDPMVAVKSEVRDSN